ncbi:metallophosphoesterase [Nocardioides acrostichi]|uniref:Metallophosphoesterase n=1 Tax=Nocardioides acrostichi TaxID=2784339 RepID=A0A930V0H8_9ACTN|nr:metallophosphoesterase [Nocardioides acrostichi]MBF4161492.1 metallophosphoesterase [Nocardioides acrostichi]
MRALRVAAPLAVWLLLSAAAGLFVFTHSSRDITVASHDAVLRPTLSGEAVLHTGPVLPDLRVSSGSSIGVDIALGKTDAPSTDVLVQRYAYLFSSPQGVESRLHHEVADLAIEALVRGLALGAVPVVLWLLVGRRRREELLRAVPTRAGAVALVVVAGLVVGVWQPWAGPDDVGRAQRWTTLADFLGPDVPLPSELDDVQVRGDVTTAQTRRLIESAVDTYDKSKTFYDDAAAGAAALDLHEPKDGQTVAVLVSDRHDNIGMDAVARAVGDAAGATTVMDAGDDTSTGSTWEAFSLDSLQAAFSDLPRWGVAGNHDNGTFVAAYLSKDGWTMLDGSVAKGPGAGTLLGVADPRSSGLGSWRDETGLSFAEVGDRLSDVACESDEPIDTMLVHDVDLASSALERGCVRLVVGGHLHVQVGPDAVDGPDGQVGYRYTTGTTGGAAYAFALGSKPRREAEITLVTYDAEGHPAGIQPVLLQTNGRWIVDDYIPLTFPDLTDTEGGDGPGASIPTTRPSRGPAPGPSRLASSGAG